MAIPEDEQAVGESEASRSELDRPARDVEPHIVTGQRWEVVRAALLARLDAG